jgi:hypothetical protein
MRVITTVDAAAYISTVHKLNLLTNVTRVPVTVVATGDIKFRRGPTEGIRTNAHEELRTANIS